MKTAKLVAAGRKYLKDAVFKFEDENKPPEGSKHKVNHPLPEWVRKKASEFLRGQNLHEAFMEDILEEEDAKR